MQTTVSYYNEHNEMGYSLCDFCVTKPTVKCKMHCRMDLLHRLTGSECMFDLVLK